MSERTDERSGSDGTSPLDGVSSTDTGSDVGSEFDPVDRTTATEDATVTDRVRAQVGSPSGGLFSVPLFALVLLLSAAAMVLAGAVLPTAGAGYVGITAVGLLVGLADERRRYLELLVAGGTVAALKTVVGNLLLTTLGVGVPLALAGAVGGGLAAAVGHYLGRDLRDGLTREL